MTDLINLKFAGTISLNGAEISDFDPKTQRLFVTGEVAGKPVLQVINVSNPNQPVKIGDIDLSSFGAGIQSVAVRKGIGSNTSIVAVAISATTSTDPGKVVFFNANVDVANPTALSQVTVGALPDMLTFTPDGSKLLVANEGEPNENYTIDPEGSISIINVSGNIATLDNTKVTTANFTAFNGQEAALKAQGIRIFGLNASSAQDFEPEYIAISPDNKTAVVTLQENNALAIVDIATSKVTSVVPLGFKNHNLAGNGLDANDRDVNGTSSGGGKINIQNWPVLGMYQPDAISSFQIGGKTYYITANEGDSRVRPTANNIVPGQGEGGIFNEETRVASVKLDPTAFPNAATLQNNANLGRLRITNTLGDTDKDGDFDQLYAFGGRSFSIWDDQGKLVFDSGDQLEKITAQQTPTFFNANNGSTADFDTRSDDKGPEPEAVTVGYVSGKPYGFIGLERAGGGVMVYDLSNPVAPQFVQYIRTNSDISPEGLKFIPAFDSPNGKPLLAVANEVSNTATLYEIETPKVGIFSIDSVSAVEGNEVNFTITRTIDIQSEQTVTVSTAINTGDTASNTDLTTKTETITFKQGETQKTFTVQTTQDALLESDETFSVSLSDPTNGAIIDSTKGTAKGTITNDDPTPVFAIASSSAVEGNGINFTITRTGDAQADQTITVSTAINTGDTASNSDLTTKTETITFKQGETQKIFTVLTTQDALLESDETFSVSLSDPTNGAIIDSTKGTAKGTITNDDPAPVFAIASSSAVEGNAIAFTITRTGDAQTDQTVTVSTAINTGDTASNTDLTTKTETVTFKQGETQKTFTVVTTQDALFESDETFSVSLSNPTNGTIIDPTKGTAKGTITNDDPAPIFAIASSSAVEGNAIAFTITRTGDSQADQTVTVFTAINTGDTASNTDLTTKTETITFKQGETQKTFTVQTTQDALLESDETFSVSLSNPTNGAIIDSTKGTAKGTINNDDIPFAKNLDNDIFTIKGTGQARLKITLTGQSFNLVNELGVFTVDDTSGKIGSDRAAYVQENLQKAQIIFSTIANVPNGFDPNNLTRVLEFDGDVKNLRFYLVRNSTTESVLRGQTSTTEVLFADASVQKVTNLGVDSYSLAWEDGSGNSTDFKDLVVKLESTNDPLPLGTKFGGQNGAEVIDLTNATQEVTAKFSVYREAAYNNLVGFYQVDDATGRIGSLNPGDDGYAQAAVGKRVAGIDLRAGNQQVATFENKKFSAGAIFAPFIITNGVTVDQVLSGQVSQVYFAYLGANSDKVDHVRLLGNNVFGFEDISGGGDRDFNDVIVRVDLK
jgi:3-phytase